MSVDAAALVARLGAIQAQIQDACASCGRDPQEVTLVAVSKNHPVEAIKALYEVGVRDFGESYVQEWRAKADALPDDIRWHLIGHLQTNKVKYLDARISLIHGVDRASLVRELARRDEVVWSILLQVNVADEHTKFGCAPEALDALFEQAAQTPNLRVEGLMTVPPYVEIAHVNGPHFARLATLLDGLRQRHPDHAQALTRLSMGMTADFTEAIARGATHVRVGTALFGERDYSVVIR